MSMNPIWTPLKVKAPITPDSNKQSVAFRKPQRITITVPKSVYDYLVETSAYEGRSLSNYASYLLERSAEGR